MFFIKRRIEHINLICILRGFLIGAAFSVKYLYGNLGAIPFRNVVHALFNMSLISQFPLISLASHSVLDEIFKNKVFYIGRKISPV